MALPPKPTYKEWPVNDEAMERLADEALGIVEPLEPTDGLVRNGSDEFAGFDDTLADVRHRSRKLADLPSIHNVLSARRRRTFLMVLSQTGNVTAASAQAGLSPGIFYGIRKANPEFAEQWRFALDTAADLLEMEALRRGVHGVEKAVWHKGMQCGTETVYSDGLLTTLLKGAKPEKYRDRVEATVEAKGGVLVVPAAAGSTADWESGATASQAKYREATQE